MMMRTAEDKKRHNSSINTLVLYRRSLIYQTKEFFQNSTLHGVRYMAESERPAFEKFLWYCLTTSAAIIAIVIIMNLWDKFQTDPTITGLDTDFHNAKVIFPTTVVCPKIAYDPVKAINMAALLLQNGEQDSDEFNRTLEFLHFLPKMNFDDMKNAEIATLSPKLNSEYNLRQLVFEVAIDCKDVLLTCSYRDERFDCCNEFHPIYTEHGFCYAFNSRFISMEDSDIKNSKQFDLYETDKKWALSFIPNNTAKIFVFSNEEYFGKEFSAKSEWTNNQQIEIRISKRTTYTVEDARQLSISQRKCIFYDEVKLEYFPEEYTFSSCMKQCRMNLAIHLCECLPPFYKPIDNVRMCGIEDFNCLDKFKYNITANQICYRCYLSCSKIIYEVEKLVKGYEHPDVAGVLVEFLIWPIMRYKREVLFGWLDLLVSFGGIASLFLGFSLLSGVEIIYYFTLRACCMLYKDRQKLIDIEESIRSKPPPPVYLHFGFVFENLPQHNVNITSERSRNYNDTLIRRKRGNTDYKHFTKSMFKSSKVYPMFLHSRKHEPYGEYLP